MIEVSSHMSALTLDVLGQASFAHDFGGVTTVEEWAQRDTQVEGGDSLGEIPDPLVQVLSKSFNITPVKILLELLGLSTWTNTVDRKARRTRQVLDEAAGEIVQNARRACSTSVGTQTTRSVESPRSKQSRSLLEQMLRATKTDECANSVPSRNQLSEQELREEIASFVVAGHETTSTWCMWALYAIALDPVMQEKVYKDICSNVASNDTLEPIRLNDVEKMEYFQALLKEVLRFYTPVGMLFRYSTRQENWHGYTVPPDTRLCIPIHLLHRHADHWERPSDFDPGRWLGSSDGYEASFFPFSVGPQNCIGFRFAEAEAKIILANLIRKFRVSLDDSTAQSGVSFTIFVAMKSKFPIKITLSQRE